jgi:hypothetical protein
MNKTTQPAEVRLDLKGAEELMRTYAQLIENKDKLMASIKNELDAYNKNAKEAEANLIAFGNQNKKLFDGKGNLVFEGGNYLHIANQGVASTIKKFDSTAFKKAYPNMIKIELKKGEIKKGFLDENLRKALKKLGVRFGIVKVVEVILPNRKKEEAEEI